MASVQKPTVPHGRRSARANDVRVKRVELYFLPVTTRVPLKFGSETLTHVTCARVRIEIVDRRGRTAVGWGETPLNVQWAWPSQRTYAERLLAMKGFCFSIAEAWSEFDEWGHALEVGYQFQCKALADSALRFNCQMEPDFQLPHLAALVCCSAFDLALHDAYGLLHGLPIYEMYTSQFMNCDLNDFLSAETTSDVDFRKKYPADYLAIVPQQHLPVWHLERVLEFSFLSMRVFLT